METFEIKTPGVDVKKIMSDIQKQIEEKKEQGVYNQYNLDRVTKLEIENIKGDVEYLQWLLKVLNQSWDINIGDPQIVNKGGVLGKPVVWLKKSIWHLLKFYTYRLFSQQKEFNSQVVMAVGLLAKRIDQLEEKVQD